MKTQLFVSFWILGFIFFVGCSNQGQSSTITEEISSEITTTTVDQGNLNIPNPTLTTVPSATSTDTVVPTETATLIPTQTATPSHTPTSTQTPTPSQTSTSTQTPTPTHTPSPIITLTPSPRPSIWITDFNDGSGFNFLGGRMGAAFVKPNNELVEAYVPMASHGKVSQLTYHISEWSAFWLKLEHLDIADFYEEGGGCLSFDIKAEEPVPGQVKIELKRLCHDGGGCEETSIFVITAISTDWQTRCLPVAEFGTVGYLPIITDWSDIEELVFVFEAYYTGPDGVVYLDNIKFQR